MERLTKREIIRKIIPPDLKPTGEFTIRPEIQETIEYELNVPMFFENSEECKEIVIDRLGKFEDFMEMLRIKILNGGQIKSNLDITEIVELLYELDMQDYLRGFNN